MQRANGLDGGIAAAAGPLAMMVLVGLLVSITLVGPVTGTAALTPLQGRLIALVTYIQAARDHCRYGIDVDLLRKAAADAGVTFRTPDLRRAVERAYALERFGPNESESPACSNGCRPRSEGG